MLSSSLNATRFAQKPLAQPSYSFADVPPARPDLARSSLQYVDTRDAFHGCMAEMLLLCKEATRRRRTLAAGGGGGEGGACAAKPLSLEYLADRIDVDDPIFGFVVRTADSGREPEQIGAAPDGASSSSSGAGGGGGGAATATATAAQEPAKTTSESPDDSNQDSEDEREPEDAVAADGLGASNRAAADAENGGAAKWQRGMLQGFITCTTFTNYQKTFQWDSLNPVAFLFDGEHHHHHHHHPSDANDTNSSSNNNLLVPVDGATLEAAAATSAAAGGTQEEGQANPIASAGVRARDEDGSLAAEMQATVRCGDIWNEGIVWPRIAEISLLGGLKCGKALVNLVIEHLECMKASGRCNYDYVVLQATDNSISFYESMGFVRVGAVVKEETASRRSDGGGDSSSCGGSSRDGGAVAEAVPDDSPEKPDAVAQSVNVVCSPTVPYSVDKAGDTPSDVARRTNVDVWDVVFLNMAAYPEICPRSRLLAGTVLQIPAPRDAKVEDPQAKSRSGPQWYLAKENETPRMIAKMFDVNCIDLVDANRHRLDGLMSNSRLKEGTRLQVSDFHLAHEGEYKPYAHWSFPDDQFEEPEPSYMMARRLDRRKGITSKQRVFEASLAVPITQFEPPSLLLPLSPEPVPHVATTAPASAHASSRCGSLSASARHRHDPKAPVPPKRPPTSFLLFGTDVRETHRDELRGLAAIDIARYVSNLWNGLSAAQKVKYEKKAEVHKQAFLREKAAYQEALEAYMVSSTSATSTSESFDSSAVPGDAASVDPGCSRRPSMTSSIGSSLFNKVVKLKPGAMTEGSEYTYWYVLTFIPDLRWCHLAPMIPVGTFDKAKSQGRPKYKLVDESLGKEVDISSGFCIPIKSRAMKRTLDADKEEWDIIDDGTVDDSCDASVKAYSRNVTRAAFTSSSFSSHAASIPQRFTTCDRLPLLAATWKRREVAVRITYGADQATGGSSTKKGYATLGKRKRPSMYDSPESFFSSSDYSEYEEAPRKKPGRPKGSKNKSTNMLKPPPELLSGPYPSSPPITARSRSQPPSCSRTSPGRGAALLSVGHRQLLHSPLVRVRAARPVVPEVVRFAELPPSPPAPVARSSRGRSLTPSTRFSSTESSLVPTLKARSRSVDFDRAAVRPKKSTSASSRASHAFKLSPKLDERWKNYVLKLKAYRQKHGNCRVPRIFPEDQSFANWVHNQRYSKTLTRERIDLLNSIGFEWNASFSNNVYGESVMASAEKPDQNAPSTQSAQEETTSTEAEARESSHVDSSTNSDSRESDRAALLVSQENTKGGAGQLAGRSPGRIKGRANDGLVELSAPGGTEPRPNDVAVHQSDTVDIQQPELPEQQAQVVRSTSEADASADQSTGRSKSSSTQPPTIGLSTEPSNSAGLASENAQGQDSRDSNSADDVSRRVSSRAKGRCTTASPPSVAGRTLTKGRSRTRSTETSSSTAIGIPEQDPASSDAERESDADDSTRSSASGRRRHGNSPLVRRSIRKRQGRHVSQRNELPAPESRALRHASSPSSRKRLRSPSPENERPAPKSPEKSSHSHKGTLARELVSLLPSDQQRKRRQVNSAGSRRSVLQS